MNIGIDIDDTISSTFDSAIYYAEKYIREKLKKEPVKNIENVKNHYYVRDIFGLTDEEASEFWKEYYERIVENVKPKTSSIEMINKLKDDGNKIIIITARWSDDYIDAFKISKEWFEKYGLKYDKLYVGIEKKDETAINEKIDLFIDDSVEQCERVTKVGIKSYLFDSETNKHINPDKDIERVLSWIDIYNKINAM